MDPAIYAWSINWVNKLPKNPILLLHGTGDWKCNAENSLQLSIELLKYKIPYKLVIYPGGDHGLFSYSEQRDEEIINHLNNFLFQNKKIDLTLPKK